LAGITDEKKKKLLAQVAKEINDSNTVLIESQSTINNRDEFITQLTALTGESENGK